MVDRYIYLLTIKNPTIHVGKYIWVFPEIGTVPQNGWFTMENPIKMDGLGGKPTISHGSVMG